MAKTSPPKTRRPASTRARLKSLKKSSKKGRETRVVDLAIIGAGPVGLALAALLKDTDITIALIDKQSADALRRPSFDGRDTALTHSSLKILTDLGIMERIGDSNVSPIKEARVLNGTSPYFLQFDARDEGEAALGYLVSNHLVRQKTFEAVQGQQNLDVITGADVTKIDQDDDRNTLTLSDGSRIRAALVVAADSRFSHCRDLMSIKARQHDFKRTVVVSRVKHEKAHDQIAYECFHYGRTLAVLPLAGKTSSIVVTLPSDQAKDLCALSAAAFSRDVTERFGAQLGPMKVMTELHAYPLVASYAESFIGFRFALLGDAAVGMHPVTAHGYNFGLYGAQTLSAQIKEALQLGVDIGSSALLRRYNKKHRQNTIALFYGTNALVTLFTKETVSAKVVRSGLLRLGNFVLPAKKLITQQLTQKMRAA